MSAAAEMSAAVVLGGSLEIRDVADIRARLLTALNLTQRLEVDISGVLAADTAGVQLLMALELEAARGGRRVAFVGQSAALARTMALLGITIKPGAV